MIRYAVIGNQTTASMALLDGNYASFPKEKPCCPHAVRIHEAIDRADAVVFSGPAARSSWESPNEDSDASLKSALTVAVAVEKPFVFLSTDRVFRGPWMFHSESNQDFAKHRDIERIRKQEQCVSDYARGLVIRATVATVIHETSVITHAAVRGIKIHRPDEPKPKCGKSNQLATVLHAAQAETPDEVNASAWTAPLAQRRFRSLVDACVEKRMTGVVHLSGTERTSLWGLAWRIAAEVGIDRRLIKLPAIRDPQSEQSLRSDRLRTELDLRGPTLDQTVEDLAAEFRQLNTSQIAMRRAA